ncbi:MAG TPA: glucosamine-6-phosphate deaminase [Bacillales bacterium]|nr:glucosamine-6-phosphate deaminase [Bacillales bacterium]
MNLISADNQTEMSRKASSLIIETVRSVPEPILGLATGSTPLGTYKELIRDHRENGTSYGKVTTINLDEYVGLDSDDPNSFRHFMDTQLFEALDIPERRIHLPNGTAENLDAECERYDILIKQTGGIDLQLLGIGENGHIGFNEPGTPFSSRTHVVELTESTRKANARFFDRPEDVPTHAITMGIDSILQSQKILLLAFGASKAKAIKRLVHGGISEDFPASALKRHDDVTLIADQEALALV